MIRTFQSTDLETLREITIICFDGVSIDQSIETTFGKLTKTNWCQRKARHIDLDVRANSEGIFVYEDTGCILGFITTRIDSKTQTGFIPNLAVLPKHQEKGIGKALMISALNYLEAKGMVMARIETLEQNIVGTAFYPRTGFREVARQIHYAMPLKNRKL